MRDLFIRSDHLSPGSLLKRVETDSYKVDGNRQSKNGR